MQQKSGAIYLRLSRDDHNNAESESITSQRLFLRQFAVQHQIPVLYEYADDGLSGTNFQRAALQNLLRAIEAGLIDTVLVKDLSRLSRDYIRTGELLEKWFPEHGVRLIAVNDGVDTAMHSATNDFFPIRAVLDDWYARDISRKVRAAIYARQKAGFCTAAALPYGYSRRDGVIVSDAEQAKIIRMIFQHYASGLSCRKIAEKLNVIGIPPIKSTASGWNDATIGRILKNQAYIGNLHLHKTEKISYKCSQRRFLSEQEAILYALPPIIEPDLFACVQQRLCRSAHRQNPKHWLSGTVYCAVCGSRMHYSGGRLICGERKRRRICSNPSMQASVLLSDLEKAFHSAGIALNPAQYPYLISEIRIAPDIVYVRVKFRKPTAKLFDQIEICELSTNDAEK